jgi:hypothetical protein
MTSASNHQAFFVRWFELLARNRLGAALLPVTGISIGYFLALSVRVLAEPFAWYIGLFGTALIGLCVVLFAVFAVTYLYRWMSTQERASNSLPPSGSKRTSGVRDGPKRKRR